MLAKEIRLSVIGAAMINEEITPIDYPALTYFGVDLSTDFQMKALL
jgi:hypothetical protein